MRQWKYMVVQSQAWPRMWFSTCFPGLKFTTHSWSHDTAKPGKLGGVGQDGEERSHQQVCLAMLETSKRSHGAASHSHRSPSSQRVLSTTPAHLPRQQPTLSWWCLLGFGETCSNPAVYSRVGRVSIVVFTENHHAEFAQEEKEDTTSLIHICL